MKRLLTTRSTDFCAWRWPAILVAIVLAGCQPPTNSEQEGSGKPIARVDRVENVRHPADSAETEDTFDYSDCVRGQAQPVVKTSVYPDVVFELNDDNHTATDTVDLDHGDKLTIRHWGCEYYVLTFRFETGRFEVDTTDTVFWLGKAAVLLSEIENGIDAPIDIKAGIEAISVHLASFDSRSYVLGQEIVISDDDIRDFVTLDAIQTKDNGSAVEISYAIGPL